jgi:ribosomal protein L19
LLTVGSTRADSRSDARKAAPAGAVFMSSSRRRISNGEGVERVLPLHSGRT